MSSIHRRPVLRFATGITAVSLIAVVLLGFSGAASAHSTNHSSSTRVAKAQTGGANPLAALLANLTHTLLTTVDGLGTTVNNTTVLLGNTTTALGTTVKRTTNNLTTVVTGLLGRPGGGSGTATPPPTSPPPSSPSSNPATPTQPTSTAPNAQAWPAIGQAPSDDPSLVTSTPSLNAAPATHHSSKGPEPAADTVLRTVSVLALVGMTGVLTFGVGAIVFGAGRRGRRTA